MIAFIVIAVVLWLAFCAVLQWNLRNRPNGSMARAHRLAETVDRLRKDEGDR